MDSIILSEAAVGFEIDCNARKLSPHTVADYFNTINKFINYLPPDILIEHITPQEVSEFLASFPTLSKKTVSNYHIGLSALWSFLLRNDFADHHLIQSIPRPKPEKRVIVPISEVEIRALFSALKYSKPYSRLGQRSQKYILPTIISQRNRVILLLMLDTGIRSTELCSILFKEYNKTTRSLHVHGKMSKDRTLYLSPRTAIELWKYLRLRPNLQSHHPLIATQNNTKIDRNNLRHMLNRLAARAGVQDVHPHRFRHTFAINYLRNGGDIYTLQRLLGHSTLDMVKHYLSIAQTDIKTAHRLASPVDHWGL